jgi:hypothetical protein
MLNKFESEKGWYSEPLEVSRDHAAGKGACDDIPIAARFRAPPVATRGSSASTSRRSQRLPTEAPYALGYPSDYRGPAEENRGVDRKHPTAQRWNHTVGCSALTSAPFQ